MIFIIYNKNREIINRIISDEEFCKQYCKDNGYTYEVEPTPDTIMIEDPQTELTSSVIDILATAYRNGVNNA